MMRILYSYGHGSLGQLQILNETKNLGLSDVDFIVLDHRKEAGVTSEQNILEIHRLYYFKNEAYLNLCDKVRRLAKECDVLILNYENIYHPDFIREMSKQIYTVYSVSDEPDNSGKSAIPYVNAFDHVFSYHIYYDENTLIAEKHKEWGAKRTGFWPYGIRKDEYNGRLTFEQIRGDNRPNDIVFVGRPYNKVDRLSKIKEKFGKRFKIYGRWGGIKAKLKYFLESGMWVTCLPNNKFVNFLQNSKIGVNIHLSCGAPNLRTFQLMANGVMQICDNPQTISKLYEIDKEIVCFESIDELLEKIEYYLNYEEERAQIAYNGHLKTINEYSRRQTVMEAIKEIKKGMLEKGITHFKDGMPIQCG